MAFSFLEFPIYGLSHCTPCPNEPRSPLHEFYKKIQFLSQFSTLRLQVKIKIIIRSMPTAWCNILPHAMHFLSSDVFNVIFEKTSITPSFFMLKKKLKLKLSRTFARPNSIPISAYFCPEIDKNV